CSRCHKQCMPRPPASNAPLPARMIKITDASGAHPMANLVDFHVRKDYICLSHCWGAVRPDCITTKETYQRNTAEIPWSSLPQTFKDAIIVTKLLGKEFLWIDSICIVQGDEHDWMAEASKMCTVYENSFLTLMATKAGDAHGGLLPKDHNVFPLLRRAWVFQERCLSLRVAHFTAEGVVYECYGRGLWSAPRNAAEFVQVWNGIVKVYSGLDLTFHSDKLPALAGLAKQLSSRSKSSGYHPGRFLAGVWENTFAEGLIWSGTNKPPGPGPLTWGAPTWSWAS
ncbi:heterokaryon incompatibility protein-domain-containing protein, partial [Lasiosphaeris hirsuta]